MKLTEILAAGFLSAIMFSGCAPTQSSEDGPQSCYGVVPLPQQIVLKAEKKPFALNDRTKIYWQEAPGQAGEAMAKNAAFLADYLEDYLGTEPEMMGVRGKKSYDNAIQLLVNPSADIPEEGYTLKVNHKGIVITGSDPSGVFYGIQTLRKALATVEKTDEGLIFPAATVEDAPHFAYRGALFDTSRHFFTVDEIKTYIDMMALHNINIFHWHITDDQGWRIEIKKYPELAEKGSFRKETLVGHLRDKPHKYDGIPHGGYYTQDQIRDIVSYAADRNVDIIPEIDLPGHMLAALHVYPELGCTGGPYEIWTKWGISDDVLCAGNDKVYEFLTDVFTEVLELFPFEYYHIGGDECPKVRWKECPKCQAKADELGLVDDEHSTREQKLQSHVMDYMNKFLQEHGKRVIGWDETIEGGLSEGAIVMSWRGEEGGIKAAQLGHDVIMVPKWYCYFDYYQSIDTENEPLAIGRYVPVDSVYWYNPLPKVLTDQEKTHILGLQANLWTEYIATFPHAQYMVLPRWAALCENQWTYRPEEKDFPAFVERLKKLRKVYDLEGYNYATHVFEGRR